MKVRRFTMRAVRKLRHGPPPPKHPSCRCVIDTSIVLTLEHIEELRQAAKAKMRMDGKPWKVRALHKKPKGLVQWVSIASER